MKKYLPIIIFISLIFLAFYSINAFFNDFSNSGGSPESKVMGGFYGVMLSIPFFFLWCFNIAAFYYTYRFFFRNGKSKTAAVVCLLISGIGFYFLKEEYMGEDGMLPFYLLLGFNTLGILLPSNKRQSV